MRNRGPKGPGFYLTYRFNYFVIVNKLKFFFLVLLVSCASPATNNYEPSKYYNDQERADLLTGIVTYIFSAPPYVKMSDRFKPEHKAFYEANAKKQFSLDRLYVDETGRHYYLVIRPSSNASEKRAAGGFFDVAEDKTFKNFRETFVTRESTDSVARGKGRFLFDQMVKGDLQRFLKMESYVQWPNRVSYYDSTKYEWVMDVANSRQDTSKVDTIKIN